MKRIAAIALVLMCFGIGLSSLYAQSPGTYDLGGQKPVKIVFATPNGPNNIESVYSVKWMDLVKKLSNGLISFDYTNGGALGSYAELLEGIEFGVYNMSITDISYIQTYVPESVILTLPCLFDNYAHATKVFTGDVGKWYADLVASKTNIKILNYYFCGFRYVASKRPIKSLADCKNMLIRSPQIKVYTDLLGLMGFSYVTMAWSEAYTAMSTGVIEAVEVPLQNIYEAGFYDLGKNIAGTRHLLSVNNVIANEAFWNSLPAVYRQIMTDSINTITAEEYKAVEAKEADYLAKLKDKGCVYNDFDAAARKELTQKFIPYWSKQVAGFSAQNAAYLDKIIALK
jgi:TRAP-type C4-dicarboxylate transport system substrate-binding protein